ncbi:MAG: YybH family protein [Solirubrobacterales bacterium]
MSSLAPPPAEAAAYPSLSLALSAGDLRGASACLARDACLLTPDGTAVHGRDSVRRVLAQLIAADVGVEVEHSRILAAGDTALLRERWRISSNGVDGTRVTGRLCPTLSLQRIEGAWKVAVLVLWGWGPGFDR